MKKIAIKEDLNIYGLGKIKKGTIFQVEKFNSRFVYVKINKCTLRLSIKEIEKVKE